MQLDWSSSDRVVMGSMPAVASCFFIPILLSVIKRQGDLGQRWSQCVSKARGYGFDPGCARTLGCSKTANDSAPIITCSRAVKEEKSLVQ